MNNHGYDNLDITNQRFGMLTGVRKVEGTRSRWVFKCDCGNEITLCMGRVMNKNFSSCGCGKIKARATHGQRHKPIYGKYYKMLDRCYSPKNPYYKNYGGRGITVCDEWRHSFEAFYKWSLENGYNPDVKGVLLSLDRIDNNKGYSPDNCRWATPKVQQNNKRSNVYYSFKGKAYTLAQFVDEYNITSKAFFVKKLKKGKTLEQIYEEWLLYCNIPSYMVEYYEYADKMNISKERLRKQLVSGEVKGQKIGKKWYVNTAIEECISKIDK